MAIDTEIVTQSLPPTPPRSPPITEDDIYDVIIVGGGPAGLAIAARLREDTPAAIFTDEEHRRYTWLRKYGKRVSVRHVKTNKDIPRGPGSSSPPMKMAVLDASSDAWLGRWNRLFGAYGIAFLRSPLLWHVDPLDRDSLLARAHEQGTPDRDLFDIGACVGKEISKHLKKKRTQHRRTTAQGRGAGLQDGQPNVDINERDRNDYFTPSRQLFTDHCNGVRDRYGLAGGVLRHETLRALDYGVVRGVSRDDGDDDDPLFTVTTDNARRYARIVVLAVGPANAARVPAHIPGLAEAARWLRATNAKADAAAATGLDGETLYPHAGHTFHLRQVPDPALAARIQAQVPTNVLVVGGGLTSVQITDLLVRRGVTRVWHLMRGPNVVVKYFDVDLRWMGKYRNREQARFWSADTDEERLAIVQDARGGGSVTPHFSKVLRGHVASGKVRLHTGTQVARLAFSPASATWAVTTTPPIADLPPMDHIYFATGIDTDVRRLPYLQTMLDKFPIETVGGFPCLAEDLQWAPDVPLFCSGKLAMLRIGPAAPNIGGVKLAAERIGLAVEERLRQQKRRDGEDGMEETPDEQTDYFSGVGSKYKCLASVGA
ncbi:uncharacterized protein SPSK_07301 [Sporothrix schenckii 1099-18]|uniref:FAD/NAD(P)-binding domain-containing protein n=2 Tax=Sporothrix schenckii TaxID=29908 RepID=U7PZQ9_SPOS1|nr:uncharacterized protein SPSK_07301 [Sporothrix schenckii 1099-18]ERT01139.1 hypothetical protein HMPREF1624_02379 [Sporothrix schenckii ATCC 58251]KJR88273.1 hypothetical protein SPSK_07301 [Sporothrix schenckii 1099-18]